MATAPGAAEVLKRMLELNNCLSQAAALPEPERSAAHAEVVAALQSAKLIDDRQRPFAVWDVPPPLVQ